MKNCVIVNHNKTGNKIMLNRKITLGKASDLISLLHKDNILDASVLTANGSHAIIATSLQTRKRIKKLLK